MNYISNSITAFLISRGWLSDELRPSCEYSLLNKGYACLFLIPLTIIALCSGCIIDVLIFLAPALSLRRRLGGWHAKTPYSCIVLSLAITLSVVLLFAPLFQSMPITVVNLTNIALILVLFVIQPAYPSQLHFTKEIVLANVHAKNRLLLLWSSMLFPINIFFARYTVLFSFSLLCVVTGVLAEHLRKE